MKKLDLIEFGGQNFSLEFLGVRLSRIPLHHCSKCDGVYLPYQIGRPEGVTSEDELVEIDYGCPQHKAEETKALVKIHCSIEQMKNLKDAWDDRNSHYGDLIFVAILFFPIFFFATIFSECFSHSQKQKPLKINGKSIDVEDLIAQFNSKKNEYPIELIGIEKTKSLRH